MLDKATRQDPGQDVREALRRRRDDAKLEAGKRADQLLAEGDMDGQRVWLRIIRAIEELQRAERRDGEAVN